MAVCGLFLGQCALAQRGQQAAHVQIERPLRSEEALFDGPIGMGHGETLDRRVAAAMAARPGHPDPRSEIKPEALWEHDQAQGLSAMDLMRASQTRTALHAALLALFARHDLLALPTTQVWPFPIGERWPKQIAGRTMDTYHRWMEVTTYATFAGLPAISVPAGFHANGRWPMGLQLIGRPQGDAALLRLAQAYANQSQGLQALRPG